MFAQVVYALLSLLLYRLLAEETGKDGFGSYALVKQGVALLFPIVMVGLVSGLPRYLALPPEERARPRRPISGRFRHLWRRHGCGRRARLGGPRGDGRALLRDLVPRRPGRAVCGAARGFQPLLPDLRVLQGAGANAARQRPAGRRLRTPAAHDRAALPRRADRNADPAHGCRPGNHLAADGRRPATAFPRGRHRARIKEAASVLWAYGPRRVPGRPGATARVRSRAHSGCTRWLSGRRGRPHRGPAGARNPLPRGNAARARPAPAALAAVGERSRACLKVRRPVGGVRGPRCDLLEPPDRDLCGHRRVHLARAHLRDAGAVVRVVVTPAALYAAT